MLKFILPMLIISTFAFAIDGRMKIRPVTYENVAIEFNKGSAALTEESKNKLETTVKKARGEGKVLRAELAVWSDKPMPEAREKLPGSEVKLAKNRAMAAEGAIREAGVSRVKTFNMALPPLGISKFMKTETSELKSVFAKKSGAEAAVPEKYRAIKAEGAPSKAVLTLVVLENEKGD